MKKFFLLFVGHFLLLAVNSQTSEALLQKMVEANIITQSEADSLITVETARQKEEEANRKTYSATAARQVQFSGYTQIRYQVFEETGKNKNDGFDIRRARFDIRGSFTQRFSYRLQADFAGSAKLLDAYAEIKLTDYLTITAGQFRIPFSLENLTSMNRFELIDFSQAVDAFTSRGKDVIGNHNGRDIGIQAGGVLIKNSNGVLAEYRFAVFNGSGINIADTANEAKDIAARLNINPLKGFSLGASYYNGLGKAIKPSPEYDGRSQARNRLGFEASYTGSGLSVKTEYITGKDGKTEKAGWYLLAGYYIIPAKLQIVAKYDSFDPDISVADNKSDNYVAGLNLNFNSWSRIQAFYTVRNEEGTEIKNNYFSVQYQIGF